MYIGKSESDKIRAENAVDYITIEAGITQYTLSQDVPGASETNVLVVVDGQVLEPEVQYAIDYNPSTNKNDTLTFNAPVPVVGQIVFVIHKGSSTYNLVPSPGSVTDESLAENLRTFLYENFIGVTGQTTFPLAKQEFIEQSLLVTIDGVLKTPGDDAPTYDYHLIQPDTSHTSIVFHAAPANGSHIGICHLAFSTVLRRASYPILIVPPGGINTADIANNAVTDAKILLENNEAIRSKTSTSGTQELIKLNASNQADILDQVVVDATKIEPLATDMISLGTSSKKFKEIHASSNINSDASIIAQTNVTATTGDIEAIAGDLKAGGDLIVQQNADINGSMDILHDLVVHGTVSFPGGVADAVPVGAILAFYGNVAPTKYLICDGGAIPPGSEYDTLRGFCGSSTPNLQQRFLIGKKGTPGEVGNIIGEVGGSFTHNHTVPNHDHALSNTNITITDTGHTHADGTYKVTIENHCHFLNRHYHNLENHFHTSRKHKHSTIAKVLPDGTGGMSTHINHNHSFRIKLKSEAGTDINFRGLPANPDAPIGPNIEDRYTSTQNLEHVHAIPSLTINSTNSPDYGIEDGGTSEILTRSAEFTAGHPLPTIGTYDLVENFPWGQTRYNRASNGDPGSMNQGTTQEFNVVGTSDESNTSSHSSISGNTNLKTGLITNPNVVNGIMNGPPPYVTVNFIIRAIV